MMIKLLEIIEERDKIEEKEKINLYGNKVIDRWLNGFHPTKSINNLKKIDTSETAINVPLYRGIGIKDLNSLNKNFPGWNIGKSFMYHSHKKYSSWTKNVEQGIHFAKINDQPYEKNIGVMLSTIVQPEIKDKIVFDFTNPNLTGYKNNTFEEEEEVILDTSVPIKCTIEFIHIEQEYYTKNKNILDKYLNKTIIKNIPLHIN